MRGKIQELAKLINNREERRWYGLAPDFEKTLGSKPAEELIDALESSLDTLPQDKLPHYCLLYFLALFILVDDKDWGSLTAQVKNKKCYRYMKTGLKIFLMSKSPNVKYKAELGDDRYKNKYEFVDFFSGYVPDYEMELRGFLNILEFIYVEEAQSFWELIGHDRNNVLFLCLFTNGRLSFEYGELTPLLLIENDVKANGAFFYLMLHFHHLVQKYEYQKTEETGKQLEDEVEKVKRVLTNLPIDRRIHFIVNFLFVERTVYPNFFIEELQKADKAILVSELEKLELDNLYKLIRIVEIMKAINDQEVEKTFSHHFIGWIKTDANPYVWKGSKQSVFEILGIMGQETRGKLFSELAVLKDTLFISSFDRQVRYSQYLREEGKAQVIEELLASN
jgi:hypothetical protein